LLVHSGHLPPILCLLNQILKKFLNHLSPYLHFSVLFSASDSPSLRVFSFLLIRSLTSPLPVENRERRTKYPLIHSCTFPLALTLSRSLQYTHKSPLVPALSLFISLAFSVHLTRFLCLALSRFRSCSLFLSLVRDLFLFLSPSLSFVHLFLRVLSHSLSRSCTRSFDLAPSLNPPSLLSLCFSFLALSLSHTPLLALFLSSLSRPRLSLSLSFYSPPVSISLSIDRAQ